MVLREPRVADAQDQTLKMPPCAAVSIIIPTYRRLAWIGRCLKALTLQRTSAVLEVLVVDDGSANHDQIEAEVRSFQKTLAVSYHLIDHAGPAAAKNAGLNRARGELLCFLDDDTVPDPDWVEKITSPFAGHPEIGIVNGRTLSIFRETGSLPYGLEQSVYRPSRRLATCNIAYRATAIRQAGGFDERFLTASWEDNDLGLRMMWAGWRHAFCPEAIVYHAHETVLAEFIEKSRVNGRGFAVFFKKHYVRRFFWVHALLLWIVKDVWRVVTPQVWFGRRRFTPGYLFFLWSMYSCSGFCRSFFKKGAFGHETR